MMSINPLVLQEFREKMKHCAKEDRMIDSKWNIDVGRETITTRRPILYTPHKRAWFFIRWYSFLHGKLFKDEL